MPAGSSKGEEEKNKEGCAHRVGCTRLGDICVCPVQGFQLGHGHLQHRQGSKWRYDCSYRDAASARMTRPPS